jgi:hypothetical protein
LNWLVYKVKSGNDPNGVYRNWINYVAAWYIRTNDLMIHRKVPGLTEFNSAWRSDWDYQYTDDNTCHSQPKKFKDYFADVPGDADDCESDPEDDGLFNNPIVVGEDNMIWTGAYLLGEAWPYCPRTLPIRISQAPRRP